MPLRTVPEVAERLRKSDTFVVRELRRKKLQGSKFGGAWHVSEAAIDAYIEAHMNVAPVEKRGRKTA